MQKIGLDLPVSGVAHSLDEARAVTHKIGRFPVIIRPAYTLGGPAAASRTTVKSST